MLFRSRIPPPAPDDGRASRALSCWRDEACVDGDVTFGPGKALTNDSGDGTTQLIVRERQALGLQTVERDLRHVIAANRRDIMYREVRINSLEALLYPVAQIGAIILGLDGVAVQNKADVPRIITGTL